MTPEVPLAIYVHVPWCVRKCPYCDFNSHVAPEKGAPFADYATALLADLEYELDKHPPDTAPQTLFFGGGTPSLMPPEVVAGLIGRIRTLSGLAEDAEITLEANPGTVERGRFADYVAAGVNRVSLGAQSFDDELLRRIGRIHSAAETLRAVDELVASGIENYNLDLMYGLPGQDEAGALADLEQAIACGPAHVSWYELTLEPGTAFFRRPPRLPAEGVLAGMETAGQARLEVAGFERYEVSAYAREGARCRHNLVYWTYGDYIGIGPGAHGKRTARNSIWRTERIRSPARWLRLAGRAEAGLEREVTDDERVFEYLLGALRLTGGFAWRDFERCTGLRRARLEPRLAEAIADGLLKASSFGVRPTARGMRYLNELQGRFLPV